jgi:hypothetical protein
LEALSGPWVTLLEDRADLIPHHVEHGCGRRGSRCDVRTTKTGAVRMFFFCQTELKHF